MVSGGRSPNDNVSRGEDHQSRWSFFALLSSSNDQSDWLQRRQVMKILQSESC